MFQLISDQATEKKETAQERKARAEREWKRQARRFELIEGNTAKFWEIVRKSELVLTRAGRIGTAGRDKEHPQIDYMAAEVEFDKQIRDKLRQGYVEVEKASTPQEIPQRGLELWPIDGSEGVEFSAEAMKYLLWRMVEVLIVDRHRAAPDLDRWTARATRKMRLDVEPEPGDDKYDEWADTWLNLTKRDRAVPMNDRLVAGFKFTEGTHWIVTDKECAFIAAEGKNRRPKRHKPKKNQASWISAWVAFHERAAKAGGYEVIPTDDEDYA